LVSRVITGSREHCGFKEWCRNEVREFYCPHGSTALLAVNTGDKWARLTLTYGLSSLGTWSGDGGPYRVCGATSTPRFDRFGRSQRLGFRFASQPVWGIPSGPVAGSQCQQGPVPSQRARYEPVTAGKSSTIIRDLTISSCRGVPRGFGAFPGHSGNRDLVVTASHLV